jgi:hypothetical protein
MESFNRSLYTYCKRVYTESKYKPGGHSQRYGSVQENNQAILWNNCNVLRTEAWDVSLQIKFFSLIHKFVITKDGDPS